MRHGLTPVPVPPPRWVVSCRGCSKSIVQSYVGSAYGSEDAPNPKEPVIASQGMELECPKCRTKAVYHREDLRFVSAASGMR